LGDNARVTSDRGHLKVFIGMAPGVGKTYRMLQEGAAEADSGRDVVVGYLESHGRAETVAQAKGLEVVPRRSVVYRGTPLEEMDLPAVLARKPELCLIDELAHTNAPGVEHEKRYEDVRDVIEAGIDVYSTVNVQHLESLNDQITQLTGSRTRETIPDEVLSMADEIVLIDLTPEALIARLKAGKVYRPERVQAALNNFFKIENLAALRETALRQVAEDVEVKRLVRVPGSDRLVPATRRDEEGLAAKPEVGPQAIAERLLALATLEPHSERVVRRAWRSAQRLDAELDVLVVRPSGRAPSEEGRKRLEALRRLCAMLGARLHVEEGDDVATVAIGLARSLGSTYVLLGAPSPPKGLRRFGAGSSDRALPMRLLRGLPGVDIRIIADPALRGQAGEGESGELKESYRAVEAAAGDAAGEDFAGAEEESGA
jgi:two-component system sensor histidine kinase KdpD